MLILAQGFAYQLDGALRAAVGIGRASGEFLGNRLWGGGKSVDGHGADENEASHPRFYSMAQEVDRAGEIEFGGAQRVRAKGGRQDGSQMDDSTYRMLAPELGYIILLAEIAGNDILPRISYQVDGQNFAFRSPQYTADFASDLATGTGYQNQFLDLSGRHGRIVGQRA